MKNLTKARWQHKDGTWWQTNPQGGKPIPAKEPTSQEIKRDYQGTFDPKVKFAGALRKDGSYDLAKLFSEFGVAGKNGVVKLKLGGDSNAAFTRDNIFELRNSNTGVKSLLVGTGNVMAKNKKTGQMEKVVKKIAVNPVGQRMASVEENFQRIRPNLQTLSTMRKDMKSLLQSPNPKIAQGALISSIMLETAARIGDPLRDASTGHFGITSLRAKHLKQKKDDLHIVFTGKSGENLDLLLPPDLSKLVVAAAKNKAPKDRLFSLSPDNVRDFLKSTTKSDLHPHDLRRYAASKASLNGLLSLEPPRPGESQKSIDARLNAVFSGVAKILGHKDAKPVLARNTYTDPILELAWADGSLHKLAKRIGYTKELAGQDALLAAVYDEWYLPSFSGGEDESGNAVKELRKFLNFAGACK